MSKFAYGNASKSKLEPLQPNLKKVAARAIELTPIDFTIVQGLRTVAQSAENIKNGTSFLSDPNKSKHITGNALDFAPLKNGKIDWNDLEAFKTVADAFFAAARELNIKIRWGGDWNMNGDYKDEIARGTYDGGHIELL
jgi:peptidoglycan L-alanyl-D-glutamate endopeptidase CwlK